jgi:hypothetical protein
MRAWRWVPLLPVIGAAAVVVGCNPYNRSGEFNAGPVDSAGFPPEYLGTGARARQAGSGVFAEKVAFVNGVRTGYFSFKFLASQTAAAAPTTAACAGPAADPLRVLDAGKPYAPAGTINKAYRFEGKCAADSDYAYDDRLDDLHYDQQGNIFTALPALNAAMMPTYTPVVSEYVASAAGVECQSIKSEKTIVKAQMPTASGKYLLWPIIDPGAGVRRFDDPDRNDPTALGGVGIQSYGWYQQYYLAYLDGGYIPTEEVMVTDKVAGPMGENMACPTVTKMVTRFKAQKLFYLKGTTELGVLPDGTVKKVTNMAPGAGYDVIEHAPGEEGYSPICKVYSFKAPLAFPMSAADVLAVDPAPVAETGAGAYIYCPQIR